MRTARMSLVLMALACASCGRTETPSGSAPAARTDWPVAVEPLAIPASAPSAQPQLTTSARGVLVSWLEHSGSTATLKFAERSAGGAWSDARTVASGDDWFVSWADVPSVMRMGDGTIVAQWLKATDLLLEAYDLRLAYSRDEGKTWSAPFAPHDDGTKTQHGFASLFELPGHGLGLVWLDGREMELDTTSPEGGAMSIRFASYDSAWTQTADLEVNGRVCECCPTSAAVTAEGVVTAFRDRSLREIRDIQVSRLEDGAWTYPKPVHVDNWEIDSCPVNGPSISARGREVAVAWFTAKDDRAQSFVAFSTDAGRTFGAPVRIDDESSLGHVDVELLDDGSAVATWVEFADRQARFRMRRVERSGARSQSIDIGSDAGERVSGYPRLARSGNELVFAWTVSADGGENGQKIKGAVARLPRATAP